MAEKARKVGLCHFQWRKKLGKLDFVIFNGKKSSESWTLQYFMVKINSESRTLSFLCWKQLGKLNFDFLNVGKKMIWSFFKVLFKNLIIIQLNEE